MVGVGRRVNTGPTAAGLSSGAGSDTGPSQAVLVRGVFGAVIATGTTVGGVELSINTGAATSALAGLAAESADASFADLIGFADFATGPTMCAVCLQVGTDATTSIQTSGASSAAGAVIAGLT